MILGLVNITGLQYGGWFGIGFTTYLYRSGKFVKQDSFALFLFLPTSLIQVFILFKAKHFAIKNLLYPILVIALLFLFTTNNAKFQSFNFRFLNSIGNASYELYFFSYASVCTTKAFLD